MKSPLEEISPHIDSQCLANRVNKSGCAVGLQNAPTPFLLVDLDHPESPSKPNSRKCDYLFFAEEGKAGLWVVPLELKSSGVNANKVSAQLQAGAKIAERVTRGRSAIRFVPVVAHGRKVHRRQYLEFAKKRIAFRKERHVITLMSCGTELSLERG